MGLFSNPRAGKAAVSHKERVARAVLSIPVLTAAADGEIDEIEVYQLCAMAAFNPSLVELGGDAFRRLIQKIVADIHAKGFKAVFQEAAEVLDRDAAHTSIAFAARVAMADGVLYEDEKSILLQMIQALNIRDEAFIEIMGVMRLMQARIA